MTTSPSDPDKPVELRISQVKEVAFVLNSNREYNIRMYDNVDDMIEMAIPLDQMRFVRDFLNKTLKD